MDYVEIPREWTEAIENGDLTTLAALADFFEEHDRFEDASCLRWAYELRRWPGRQGGALIWLSPGEALVYRSMEKSATVPIELVQVMGTLQGTRYTVINAFERLLTAWRRLGAKQMERVMAFVVDQSPV